MEQSDDLEGGWIALEPLCGECGKYFERIPSDEDHPFFVEFKCGCRTKVLDSLKMRVLECCEDAVQSSLFLNGLVEYDVIVRGQGRWAQYSPDVQKFLEDVRSEARGVSDEREEILKFIQDRRKNDEVLHEK